MKTKILQLIDSYWKFDDNQQPLSSWHDKQDLLKVIDELPADSIPTPEKLIQAQKEYIEFLDKYVTTHHITCDEDEFQKGITLRQAIKDAEADLKLKPSLTPEKLGEMFDAEWKNEEGLLIPAIDKQTFIRLVNEITGQIRQQVETEMNLPTNEAVKEWFCEGDNSSSFWNSGSWKNGQVCTEIIDALKYFIIDNPVRNSKAKDEPKVNYFNIVEMTDKESFYMYDKMNKAEIINMLIQCNKIINSTGHSISYYEAKHPDTMTISASATEQTRKSCEKVKEYQDWLNEIPEDRLRDELIEYVTWISKQTFPEGNFDTIQWLAKEARTIDQYLNERKENKK